MLLNMAWKAFMLIVLFIIKIECARILAYFTTPSISHQIVFRPITQALAKRGHEVTAITTDPLPKGSAPANLTEIDVHDVSYQHWKPFFKYHKGDKKEDGKELDLIFQKLATIIKVQMDTPAVQKALQNKNRKYFDLVLVEGISRPLLGFGHILNASIVQVNSVGASYYILNIFGAPVQPILYPTFFRQRVYNLNLWEKIMEIIRILLIQKKFSRVVNSCYINEMKKNFGNDIPHFEELTKKIQLVFFNEHPIWASNRPFPPNMIYMGGIHEGIHQDLPQSLQNYLDSSKNGVIYVSFGTNVLPSLLPQQKIEVMRKVFSDLPYDVLWKWDKDVLPGQSNNIKTSKWFPQNKLLKHPNVKLFITQGGLQSTDETINAAVPVIGIPMLGDQWYNIEQCVHHGIGIQLDITTLNEKEFKESITKVIHDKSYKKNILRLRSLMRDFPIKPVDNAVWWMEHVMKYGGSHLKNPAVNLSWAEYYEIELFMIIFSILVVILILLGFVLNNILKFAYEQINKQTNSLLQLN